MPLFNEELGHNPALQECAEYLSIYPVLVDGYLHTAIIDRAVHYDKGSQIIELIAGDEQDLLEILSDAFSGSRQKKTSLRLHGFSGTSCIAA